MGITPGTLANCCASNFPLPGWPSTPCKMTSGEAKARWLSAKSATLKGTSVAFTWGTCASTRTRRSAFFPCSRSAQLRR